MVFGKTLLDEIDKEAKRQQEVQREKLRISEVVDKALRELFKNRKFTK